MKGDGVDACTYIVGLQIVELVLNTHEHVLGEVRGLRCVIAQDQL